MLEQEQLNNPKNLLYFKTEPEKLKTENILWPLFCHLATVEFTIDRSANVTILYCVWRGGTVHKDVSAVNSRGVNSKELTRLKSQKF